MAGSFATLLALAGPTSAAPASSARTTTAVFSSLNPSVFGQSVTFSATVTVVFPGSGTAAGTVTFRDGTSTLGSAPLLAGIARFSTAALSVGTHQVTASYGGVAGLARSTSIPLAEQVNDAATSTSLTSSPNPSALGQSVTFTATVAVLAPGSGTAGGTVTFSDGSSVLGSASLSAGVARFSTAALSVGTHQVTADYGGGGGFAGSTDQQTHVVGEQPTTTQVSSSATRTTVGQPVALMVVVAGGDPPSGEVSFSVSAQNLGSAALDSNATATLRTTALPVGTDVVTARYLGNGSFAPSSATITIHVTAAQPSATPTRSSGQRSGTGTSAGRGQPGGTSQPGSTGQPGGTDQPGSAGQLAATGFDATPWLDLVSALLATGLGLLLATRRRHRGRLVN